MKLKKSIFLLAILALAMPQCSQNAPKSRPNIIVIYVDDLGYGDVGCYGAKGVETPNVDKLAKQGIQFTDAHCSAATCTPSRFSILTGSYAFRNKAAILPGDAPLLIRPGTPTLPGMLQRAGYVTAVIGKWHLGLGNGDPKWNEALKPGPLEIGFDYSFLVPATLDRVPTVFVENHQVVKLEPGDPLAVNYDHKIGDLPTGLEHPEMLKMTADVQHSGTIVDSISRIGFMTGGKAAWWKDEDIADVLVKKVDDFIDKNKSHPFFLYFAITDIHVPRAPNARFVGKSTMGPRGDAIAEMDWSTGAVMKILDKLGLTENTLVIFTSDNGPVLDDGYGDHAVEMLGDDKPWGPFKGGKYSAYEAGTRMPTIIRWPAKIKPGTSDALWSQVDLYASFAALTGQKLNANEAPDSFDMLDEMLGKSRKGRTNMLEESFTLGLRYGDWKYIAPQVDPAPDWLKNKTVATGLSDAPQLYDLKSDIGETKNIIGQNPGMAGEMKAALEQIQKNGGTRPGYKGQTRK